MSTEEYVKIVVEIVKISPPLLWVIFAIIAFIILFRPIRDFALAVSARIKSGAQAEIGPIKLDAIKINSKSLDLPTSSISSTVDDSLDSKRQKIYDKSKNYFIAHRLYPSKEEGQTYDIWIYVVPHRIGLSGIKSVSYYFGPAWNDRVFTSKDRGKSFGVVVSAYGPMVTYVTINLKNDEVVETWKYIDFENGSLGSRGGV